MTDPFDVVNLDLFTNCRHLFLFSSSFTATDGTRKRKMLPSQTSWRSPNIPQKRTPGVFKPTFPTKIITFFYQQIQQLFCQLWEPSLGHTKAFAHQPTQQGELHGTCSQQTQTGTGPGVFKITCPRHGVFLVFPEWYGTNPRDFDHIFFASHRSWDAGLKRLPV